MRTGLAAGLALALVFQLVASPLYELRIGAVSARPSFPVAWAAAWALLGSGRRPWLVAFGLGLGFDAISLDPWGAQAAAMGLAAAIAHAACRRGIGPGLPGSACLLVASLAAELGRGFVLWLWREESAWPAWSPALASAALTAAASVAILPLLAAWRHRAAAPRPLGV